MLVCDTGEHSNDSTLRVNFRLVSGTRKTLHIETAIGPHLLSSRDLGVMRNTLDLLLRPFMNFGYRQ